MGWPDLTEYHEAIQHPSQAFSDAGLKATAIELDRFGMPKPATGGNAVVYKGVTGKETWAIRCFLRPITDHAERYEAISKHLRKTGASFGTEFNFVRDGICIRGAWYPIVKMAWVDGKLLHRYIEDNVQNRGVLAAFRARFLVLLSALEENRIAHGDLQQGNILVRDDELLLVDYDGMWVPALDGRAATELGHRSYQHPKRNETEFGPGLDRFSALVIYLSVLALEHRPALWEQFHTGDNLIFVREDFSDSVSALWKAIEAIESDDVQRLAATLRTALAGKPLDAPRLETALKKQKKQKKHKSKKSSQRASTEPAKPVLPTWLASANAALSMLELAPRWKILWTRPGERTKAKWKVVPTPAATAAVTVPRRKGFFGLVAALFCDGETTVEPEPVETRKREEVRAVAPGMASAVLGIGVSASGRQLSVVTKNGECGFWNVLKDEFTPTTGKIAGKALAAIAAKASIAVVASGDEAEVWDLAKWVKRACPLDSSSTVRAIALSPDGTRAAFGYAKPLVQVVDVQKRTVLDTWDALSGEIRAIDFSDDLELVFCGTAVGTLHWLRLSQTAEKIEAKKIATAQSGTSPIRAVAVSFNRQLFASASDDGKLTLFGRDMVPTFTVPMGKIESLCFLGQKGFAIAVGTKNGTIKVVTVGTGQTIASFAAGRASIRTLAASSDPICLVWGADDGQVGQVGLP